MAVEGTKTTFLEWRVNTGRALPESQILPILQKELDGIVDVKKIDQEKFNFSGVDTKEKLKTAILKWLKSIDPYIPLMDLWPNGVIYGAIDAIIDGIWSLYEVWKQGLEKFWEWATRWIGAVWDQIVKLFSDNIGTPQQIQMRNFIDKIYGNNYRIEYFWASGFVVKNSQGTIVNLDMRAINGEASNPKLPNLQDSFQQIILERSLTSGWRDNMSDMFREAKINPEKLADMGPKELANMYLKYAQRGSDNIKTLSTTPSITSQEVEKMVNLPPDQKDVVLSCLKDDANAPTIKKEDLDYLKKAIKEHTRTGLASTHLAFSMSNAQDISGKMMQRLWDGLEKPGDILKYLKGPEIFILMTLFMATCVFDVTGKRSQIWKGLLAGGGIWAVANVAAKAYNWDSSRGINSVMAEALKAWWTSVRWDVRKNYYELGELLWQDPENIEVLLSLFGKKAVDLFNLSKDPEKHYGVNVDDTNKVSLKNYKSLFSDSERSLFAKKFWWEQQAEQKICDVISTFLDKIQQSHSTKVQDRKWALNFIKENYWVAEQEFTLAGIMELELRQQITATQHIKDNNTWKPKDSDNINSDIINSNLKLEILAIANGYTGKSTINQRVITKENFIKALNGAWSKRELLVTLNKIETSDEDKPIITAIKEKLSSKVAE